MFQENNANFVQNFIVQKQKLTTDSVIYTSYHGGNLRATCDAHRNGITLAELTRHGTVINMFE